MKILENYDLFFFGSESITEQYINFDCNAGEQIVTTAYPYNLILRYADENAKTFWDAVDGERDLDMCCDCNWVCGGDDLYDENGNPVYSEDYLAEKEDFLNSNPDVIITENAYLGKYDELRKIFIEQARASQERR